MVTRLYGIFYPPESGKVSSVFIEDATTTQIQERIEMLKQSITEFEKAKLDPTIRHKPETLDGFINSLNQEIGELTIDILPPLIRST